jgi:hypothetical protein
MKVSSKDLDNLVSSIRPIDTNELRKAFNEAIATGRIKANDPDMWYRWRVYHLAFDAGFRFSEEYNDAHIDTALRRAVPQLSDF